jgi:hypothetical protein
VPLRARSRDFPEKGSWLGNVKMWRPPCFEMIKWRISREATCDGSWRSWCVAISERANFYTESVPSLFQVGGRRICARRNY